MAKALGGWVRPSGQPAWARPVLLGVALLAGLLYGWRATGNLEIYYAAGVRSMSSSWHDFFFAGFDPSGTVSLDKLPGAFWVQALSARLFGFSAVAIVAPQVAEGVLTILVLYRAVRRLAGPVAGLVAALVLAVSPATVALNRGNISDTLMILLLALAADATVTAVLHGRARSAVAAGVWVGLAFQAKMLEAWLILPVLAATYALCGPDSLRRRAVHLAGMGVAAVAVSLSWMTMVSLLPASGRPYVDGSTDDSLFHQVFVYNGFGRLQQDSPNQLLSEAIDLHIGSSGPPAWDRFLAGAYGRDIGWLIPAALLIAVIGMALHRRAGRQNPARAGLVLWGGWLVVFLVALSVDSSINSYYAAALSPAIAALVGMGAAMGAERRTTAGRASLALAAVTLVTVGYSAWLLPAHGTGLPGWLFPAVIAAGLAAAVVTLVGPHLAVVGGTRSFRLDLLAAGVALLLVPAVASSSIVTDGLGPFDTPFESRGVDAATRAFLDTIPPAEDVLPDLVGARFGAPDLMAAQTSALAAPFIYVSGLEVLPIGGYTGTIPAPSLAQLRSMIHSGRFHIVLQARTVTDPRLVWIDDHCQLVPNSSKDQFVAYFCGSASGAAKSPSSPGGTAVPAGPPTQITRAQLVAAALRVRQLIDEYPGFRVPAATLQALKANPADPTALAEARKVLGPNFLSDLVALTQVPQADILYLQKWGPIVSKAIADGQLPNPEG